MTGGDTPMTRGRRADSARRRQRVIKAINEADGNGTEMSVSAVARAANRELIAQLNTAPRRNPANSAAIRTEKKHDGIRSAAPRHREEQ